MSPQPNNWDYESHTEVESYDSCVEDRATALDSWQDERRHRHLCVVRDPYPEPGSQRPMSLEQLTREGRAWLERLEPHIDRAYEGSFIAIDVDSGEYVVADTVTRVIKRARAELASENVYVGRVGAPAAYALHTPR